MMRKPISASWRIGATALSLSESFTETNTVPGERQLAAAAELALGEGDGVVAVDAHHLAGRAHLRTEHGVDAGEAREREHRLLHRDMVEAAAALQPEDGKRLPAITLAAMPATGSPIALATKGTVRLARGLTSST